MNYFWRHSKRVRRLFLGLGIASVALLPSFAADSARVTNTSWPGRLLSIPILANQGQAFDDELKVPGEFSSIQAAIDAAGPGDSILVEPGVYVGSLRFNGKLVSVQSTSGAEATTIVGDGGSAVDIGPGGELIGFTITNGSATFGAGMLVHGAGTIVKGNIFHTNSQGGGGFGAGIGGNSSSPTIEQNIFRNNSCDDQFLSGVISFVNSSSPRIVNNILKHNPCRAINMTLPVGSHPEVINNTMVGNRAGVRVDRRISAVIQIYRNNIVVGNEIGLEIDFGSELNNPTWENNLVFDNIIDYDGIANQTGIAGNISDDPLFVDPGIGDYHLRAGSSAIDAGANAGAPTVDFEGDSRPLDGDDDGIATVDMGVYEFTRVQQVAIDIKPGNDDNFVKPGNDSDIPVAILTTDDFDATTVDPLSVQFGPDGAYEVHGRGHDKDVDGDGDLDRVFHFDTLETGIDCGDTEASLHGETYAGQQIEGTDSVITKGKACK